MSLETSITRAWQKKAKWLYLFLPLSWLYSAVSSIRRMFYKQGVLSSYRAPVPVMVIGNITVGGSGKTPLIISLVKHLQRRGITVGVISRGYGGDSKQMPAIVTLDSTPNVVGDEPCLIVQSTLFYGKKRDARPVDMAVCPNRQQAIELLLKHNPDIEFIIADDGLQHYKLQRDIEWIVVDSHRGFGNEKVLPVGFLREPLNRLDGATIIYHQTEQSDDEQPLTMRLKPAQLEPLLTGLTDYQKPQDEDTVIAISGIGYPTRFFNTLKALGFSTIECPYPDHHDFTFDDLLQFIEQPYPIITTSKDAVKLWQLADKDLKGFSDAEVDQLAKLFTRIWVLPVSAELSLACYDALDKELKAHNIL
ncbi:tetraacyldisaccharide 4'-kinase [Psychrobacter sp. HD31]|uniref:tetraacyldisaccharide 4'-kinase n=1 Tax=Psychrobacter sp. HD31 TaxID=3112003 RepID=UPI003DA3C6D4